LSCGGPPDPCPWHAPPGGPTAAGTLRPIRVPGAPTLEDMPEFIYQMRAVRKAHGDKVILDNVTLAFLPGAKIGVVGPNGMGKSTLLRMMAGVEQPSNGDAKLVPGFTVGLLAQEPQLDDRDAWDLDSQVEQAMDALRCPPPDSEVSVLSGGERRRVALCALLLAQ